MIKIFAMALIVGLAGCEPCSEQGAALAEHTVYRLNPGDTLEVDGIGNPRQRVMFTVQALGTIHGSQYVQVSLDHSNLGKGKK